jgi:uncharacterized Zn finger protein
MPPKIALELTDALIEQSCSSKTFERSEEYIDAISNLSLRGNELSAQVFGSEEEPYRVNITFDKEHWKFGGCTCPTDFHPCKHIIAVLRKVVIEGFDSVEPSFKDVIRSLDATGLRKLLMKIVRKNPEVLDGIKFSGN